MANSHKHKAMDVTKRVNNSYISEEPDDYFDYSRYDNEDDYDFEIHTNATASGNWFEDVTSLIVGVIGLVIFIAVCVWGWNNIVVAGWDKYVKKYDKPWWSGTALQEVCTTGDTQKCYTLQVSSDGENIGTVYFPNGGYLYGDSECYQAAKDLYDFDRFCRFWDQEGRRWDINPL